MLKKHLLIALLMFFCGNTSAQTLKGTIKNADSREPVSGALIRLKGSEKKVLSGVDGTFSLDVSTFPVELNITASKFKSAEERVETNQDNLVFYLFPVVQSLSEVVLRSLIIPKEILNTPASVSTIHVEEIERTDETNLLEALNAAAGVYIHRGALNTNKIAIRGVGARSQYSTNKIKAYFMEIPLTTAEGELTLDDIDPAVVERAEVIKGPVSSMFGAGLGGVINLYPTNSPRQGTGTQVKSSFGSYGLLKNTIRATYATDKTNLSAIYNHLSTEGYRENGSYNRTSFTMNGRVAGDDDHSVSMLANFVRLKAYIPSSLNRENFENEPESAAYTWAASRGYESYDKGLLGFSYRRDYSERVTNTTSIFMNFRNGYEPRPFDILKEEQVSAGFRTRFGLENEVLSLPYQLSIGGEFYREWYDTMTFENLYEDFSAEGSVKGGDLSSNQQDRSYYNIFAQWNLSIAEKIEFETGANLNSTRYELIDLYTNDDLDQSGKYRFKSILSPRVGLVYSPAYGKNIYASISHGFSTPTVAETLTPKGLINTSLKPETGVNFEIGFKGNFLNNRLYAEVAAYSIQVENLLVAERVAEDQYIGRNAGKTDHNGFEFLLNYNFRINDWLEGKSFVNGSFNEYTFDDFEDAGKDFSGNDLPAVPAKSIHAGLDFFTSNGLSLFTSFQYEGKMPLNDENSGYTKAYELVNLKFSYTPEWFRKWKVEIFMGVNNVFDEHYAASIVPNAVGFGKSSPRYFYPGKPRNYFGGISLEYLL